MRALARLEHFDPRHAGAFPAYLRRALLNAIRDEIRKAKRRAIQAGLSETIVDPRPTPLETAVGRDVLDRYEHALSRLSEDHRAALVLRHELGLAYEEVGQLLGGRTANAARLLAVRAVKALAVEMNHG
jgi:RNA polymerase sigma factor (sigma-70 family)